MNVALIEKNKKFIFISILGLGVSSIVFFGWDYLSQLKIGIKLVTYKPSVKELQQAWEGFQYDPQNINAEHIREVLNRSLKLHFKLIQQLTQIMSSSRRSSRMTIQEQLSNIIDEIGTKQYISDKMIKQFLEYKNYSYEEFVMQKDLLKINNQEVFNVCCQHSQLLTSTKDPNTYQLYSINKFYEYLKLIGPFLKQIKPQLDRVQSFIQHNNLLHLKQIFIIFYLDDIIYMKFKFEFAIFRSTLGYLDNEKIPQKIKEDFVKQLKELQLLLTQLLQ